MALLGDFPGYPPLDGGILPGDDIWPPPEWAMPAQPSAPIDLAAPLVPEPVATEPAIDPLAEPAPEPYFDEEGWQRDIVEAGQSEETFAPDDFGDLMAAQPPAEGETFPADDFGDLDPLAAEPDNAFIDDLIQRPVDPIEAEIARQSALSPEDLAADNARREAMRASEAATAAAASAAANEQEARDNYLDQKVANAAAARELADIKADYDELAKAGINQDGWVDSLTGGQTLAAGIMAIASGLLAARTGDNSGIQYITGQIDKNIEMQKEALGRRTDLLDKRRGMVADMYARSGNDYRAAETVRLAAYSAVEQRLAAEQNKYDPNGTAAAAILRDRMAMRGKIAAGEAALEKETFERSLKVAQEQRAAEKHRREMAPRPKAGPSFEQQKWHYENRTMQLPDGRIVPDPRRLVEGPAALSDKQRKERADADKAVAEAEAIRQGQGLTDSQGNVIGRPRLPAKAGEIIDATVAYEDYRKVMARIADRVQAHQSAYKGIGSDRWPSEAKTEIDQLREDAAAKLAKARDPASTIRDAEIESAMKSIPDLDSWTSSKNPLTVYRTAVKTTDDKYETFLGANIVDFERKNSPTRKYQAADEVLLGEDVQASSPDQLLEEASAPLWGGLTDAEKPAAAERLGKLYGEINDRRENWTPREILRVSRALEESRGSLTPEQYKALREQLLAAVRDK